MSAAVYASFVFTVLLLLTTAYFLMGGLPLLILKHDTPLDANFIRAFFNLYYKAAIGTACGAALSFGWWGRPGFAAGAAAIALIAVLLRKHLIAAMENAGGRIQASDSGAVRSFRKLHSTALLVNLVQLCVLVWGVLNIRV